MELSLLCESKIFLCIVDKVEKLTIYSSENDINKFLGTYLQKINQNKIQKDILSNNDYNTLFTNNSTKDETASKYPEDNVIYSFENDQSEEKNMRSITNVNVDYEEQIQDDKMGFMEHFDSFGTIHQDNDFQNYLTNQQNTLFEEEQDLNSASYKVNTYRNRSEEDGSFQQENSNSNMNQIFSTIFSTDNNSVTSNNTNNANAQLFKSQKAGGVMPVKNNNKLVKNNTLCSKRNREDINKKQGMMMNLNNNSGQNINFAVINHQNLASLFPNLNLLSQNIGVVNWVVPMNNVEEH